MTPKDIDRKAMEELTLTTARILRAHIRETLPNERADIIDLNNALRPFESNVTALHSNEESR